MIEVSTQGTQTLAALCNLDCPEARALLRKRVAAANTILSIGISVGIRFIRVDILFYGKRDCLIIQGNVRRNIWMAYYREGPVEECKLTGTTRKSCANTSMPLFSVHRRTFLYPPQIFYQLASCSRPCTCGRSVLHRPENSRQFLE